MDRHERGKEIMASMRLPLIVAPMFLVSGPGLVLASCRAGVIGSFPFPNARTLEVLDEWLSTITATLGEWRAGANGASIGPLAANMVVHSTYDRLQGELELVKKHQPPIVITALGSPKAVIETVHAYGGLVFADVNSVAYARKAVEAGVDGLILVSAGAGGHTGQMAGFSFVPAVREFFDGYIALAGSICNGGAIRAAEALGADLVDMGTTFIATTESMASDKYKEMILAAEFEDLVLSNALTGANAYYLRSSIERMGLDPNNLGKKDGPDLQGSQAQIKAWRDVWSAGHGVGTIHQCRPTQEIIDQLAREYDEAVALPHFTKRYK